MLFQIFLIPNAKTITKNILKHAGKQTVLVKKINNKEIDYSVFILGEL